MNFDNPLSSFQERLASRKTAVLIPCLNEEQPIAKVIQGFRKELPEAAVCADDNNPSVRAALIAGGTWAIVVRE